MCNCCNAPLPQGYRQVWSRCRFPRKDVRALSQALSLRMRRFRPTHCLCAEARHWSPPCRFRHPLRGGRTVCPVLGGPKRQGDVHPRVSGSLHSDRPKVLWEECQAGAIYGRCRPRVPRISQPFVPSSPLWRGR